MIHHYDHRWATYTPAGDTRDLTPAEKRDSSFAPLPRYWVVEQHVAEALAGRWAKEWLLGFRDICRSTDERTVIAGIFPGVAIGNNLPLLLISANDASLAACLTASLSSFSCDFAARFKVGGTHLNFFIAQQIPVLPPSVYSLPCPWADPAPAGGALLADWLLPRVLELVYTTHDLAPFARDCGYDGPPFQWDEERRFLLRCELDAAFFHLYGIARADVDYIMDTFPIVRRKDEAAHGEYRTKRVILELYDDMAAAIAGGPSYATRLAPPLGPDLSGPGDLTGR